MIVPNRFTFDTNILIYAVNADAPDKHTQSYEMLEAAVEKDCVLTLQAINEFFNAARRKDLAAIDDAISVTQFWQQCFRVVCADQDTFSEAVEYVRDHRIQFWDAMLWITAKQAGCEIILSEDMQHGRRFGGVQIVNPFFPDSKDIVDRLLGAVNTT